MNEHRGCLKATARSIAVGALLASLGLACNTAAPSSPDAAPRDATAEARVTDGRTADQAVDHAVGDAPGVTTDLPPSPLIGVYAVSGSDATYGSYTGTAEVRQGSQGELVIHHVQLYDQATFEGDRVALAWEGKASGATPPFHFSVTLDRVGWITSYKTWDRKSTDPKPVTFAADFTRTSAQVIAGVFAAPPGSGLPSFSESWTWTGPGGPAPIWRNQRQAIPGHAPVPPDQKAALFATFASFHAMPAVKSYVTRPEFQAIMHYWVHDPTDYDFYQQPGNKDVVRVIQKVVDPISLVEARVRQRAFRQTLAQKAAIFDSEVPAVHLNAAGMYGYYDPVAKKHIPDGDGLEWTGDYVASQAMRYLATQQAAALDNLLRALKGVILCYEITGKKGNFARTIRDHVDDGDDSWVRGKPPYQQYDWLTGGNNDMIKGIQYGFLWAHLVLEGLSGHDDLKQKMVKITDELLSESSIAADKTGNETFFRLLAFVLDGDLAQYAQYLGLYFYYKLWMVDWGNGSTYQYGISDWSGNYMNIKSLSFMYVMEHHLQKEGKLMLHVAEYRQALTVALQHMRQTRLGFYQLAAATLGDFTTAPPELEESLWVMRAFAAPKVHHPFDHRINPGFCMSPVPALPWKMDWTSPDEDRTFSLTVYPLFERNPSNIEWKENPAKYEGGGEGGVRSSGPEFLLAYWLGRYFGSISPSM